MEGIIEEDWIESEEMEYLGKSFWEEGFYDKSGKKMETMEVLAALFKKTIQLEKRIEQLEEENAILRDIGMFDLDKTEDIFNDITFVRGYDWKKSSNFTVDSEDCSMPYLLYYISQYISDKRSEDEPEGYYW
jgi:hypothetical protein